MEEADLQAACMFFADINGLSTDEMIARIYRKRMQFHEWQAQHGTPGSDFQKLLAGAQAAYWHLDTYGFPYHTDDILIASQKRVFELLREWCPPRPGRM